MAIDTSYSGLVEEIGLNKEKGKEIIKMLSRSHIERSGLLRIKEKEMDKLKAEIQEIRAGVDNALLVVGLTLPLGIMVENSLLIISSTYISLETNILL